MTPLLGHSVGGAETMWELNQSWGHHLRFSKVLEPQIPFGSSILVLFAFHLLYFPQEKPKFPYAMELF
jgi:hypothetical protein